MPRAPLSALLPLALALACGDSPDPRPTPDAGNTPTKDTGPSPRPGDEDGDDWEDADDNCPATFNPEQRDRDQDGHGDACDGCPATPRGGPACAPVAEVEPNDESGQSLSLPPTGEVLVVAAVMEAPGSRGAVDRFQVMIPGNTLLYVRAARAAPSARFEPEIELSGGAFVSARASDDLFAAERKVYVAEAGVYALTITDRRLRLDGTSHGAPDFHYELALAAEALTPTPLSAPVAEELELPADAVAVFEIDLPAARTRVLAEARDGEDGPSDPILLVEDAALGLVGENDDFLAARRDARLVFNHGGGRLRVALDRRFVRPGTTERVRLVVDQPRADQEVEPNDTPELASELVFPGQSEGTIGTPRPDADVDVFRFEGQAGQAVRAQVLLPGGSNADPHLELGRLEEGALRILYSNADSSGDAPRIDAVLDRAGTYFVVVRDEQNQGPPFVGGPTYAYQIFTEVLPFRPNEMDPVSTGTVSGSVNPGGRLVRHRVVVEGERLLTLRAIEVGTPELEPRLRLYGDGLRTLLADGPGVIAARVPAGTYDVTVHNQRRGQGGPSYTYRLAVGPVVPAEVPEGEPAVAPALPARLVGTLGEADRDVFRFRLERRGTVDVLAAFDTAPVRLALGRPGDPRAFRTGDGGLRGVDLDAGDYELEVTGDAGLDYSLALLVR